MDRSRDRSRSVEAKQERCHGVTMQDPIHPKHTNSLREHTRRLHTSLDASPCSMSIIFARRAAGFGYVFGCILRVDVGAEHIDPGHRHLPANLPRRRRGQRQGCSLHHSPFFARPSQNPGYTANKRLCLAVVSPFLLFEPPAAPPRRYARPLPAI